MALDVKIIVLLSPVRRKKTFSVTFRKGGGEDSEAAVLAGQSECAVFVLDEDRPRVSSLEQSKKKGSRVVAAATALGACLDWSFVRSVLWLGAAKSLQIVLPHRCLRLREAPAGKEYER